MSGNDQFPNVDQLRAAIDGGQTRDKVAFPDPAAAPLGTDEEAAGTPLPPAAVRATYERETSRRVSRHRSHGDRRGLWILMGLMAAIGIALTVGYLA